MNNKILTFMAGALFLCFALANFSFAAELPQIRGVAVHVIDKPDDQIAMLDISQKMGFDSVRDEARWRLVEKVKGKYEIPPAWDQFVNQALARNLQPLLILAWSNPLYDGGDKPRSKEAIDGFVKYASFVVQHFKGRVRHYEIWNEWDTKMGSVTEGSPEDYAKLFQAVYPALKKVDPSAIIIAGAGTKQTPWIEGMARFGVVKLADGIAMHPYVYWKPGKSGDADFYISTLKYFNAKAVSLSGRPNVNFYITEIGWPSYIGKYGRTEDEVAQFAANTFRLSAKLPFVRGVWWYDLKNDGQDPQNMEHNFGLIEADNNPKPAANAVKMVLRQIKQGD